MKQLTRRQLLRRSIVAGAVMGLPGRCVLGANDRIRVGVIGLGIRGPVLLKQFDGLEGVEVAAICDPDSQRVARHAEYFTKQDRKVDQHIDLRRIMDDKSIDVVVTASPNNWHGLVTVWGCQAGKDVYVEKPASYNIYEGRKMVEAARKYKRIVQTGTQNRSDVGFRGGVSYIREGKLGRIKWVYGLWYSRREGIGKVKSPQTVPAHIDYDLWTGPAALVPLMRKNLHYDWHWQWHAGNGDMANLGAHQVDDCRWAAGHSRLPERVMSFGGRFDLDDDGQTPNTQLAVFDYKEVPIVVEIRNLPMKKGSRTMDHLRGVRAGNIIQCEHGYFAGGRGGGWAYDNDGKKIKQFPGDGGGGHAQNFIDAVRSRKRDGLHAEILEGHTSAALCHMANISYRIGQVSDVETISSQLGHNEQAGEALSRIEKHLLANEIDLDETPLRLGPWVKLDNDFEKITVAGESQNQEKVANALMKRSYRSPFVVPDKV